MWPGGAGVQSVGGAVEAIAQGEKVTRVDVEVRAVGEQQVAQRRGCRGVDDGAVEGSRAVRPSAEDSGAGLERSVLVAELEGGEAESFVFAERPPNGATQLFPIEARYRLGAVEGGGPGSSLGETPNNISGTPRTTLNSDQITGRLNANVNSRNQIFLQATG